LKEETSETGEKTEGNEETNLKAVLEEEMAWVEAININAGRKRKGIELLLDSFTG